MNTLLIIKVMKGLFLTVVGMITFLSVISQVKFGDSQEVLTDHQQFLKYCKERSLDNNLSNWAQVSLYDKDTGRSYSKYLCRNKTGEAFVLVRANDNSKMTIIKEIKK